MVHKGDNLDRTSLAAYLAVLVVHFIFLFVEWGNLPNDIAIHYTDGQADRFGSKYILFILPVISLAAWLILGFLKRRPESYTYFNLTDKNKDFQYMKGRRMMTHMQYLASISIIFMNLAFLKEAAGEDHIIQLIIAVILIGLCFLLPIFFLIWSARLKES